MSDDTKVAIALGIITITFLIALFGGAYLLGRAECNRINSDSGIRTSYRLPGGCYVEVNGRMIPKENWRGEYEQ